MAPIVLSYIHVSRISLSSFATNWGCFASVMDCGIIAEYIAEKILIGQANQEILLLRKIWGLVANKSEHVVFFDNFH